MKLVLATKNKHKVEEINKILGAIDGIEIVSLENYPNAPDVIEDQDTFVGNASKKALEIAKFTGEMTLADDSGLEVDALNGAPGIYSARYAGEGATYQEMCQKLLSELKNIPKEKRSARFKTVVALATPEKVLHTTEGVVEGTIINEMRGSQGFGYDPIFLYEPANKTFAELSAQEKNEISHRARALKKMANMLK